MENELKNEVDYSRETINEPRAKQPAPIAEVISIKDWMVTILITAIPVVGIIMIFVWAFSKEENLNKANWAKANLIWFAIFSALAILFMLIVFGSLSSISASIK
jgi:heme/copper-type cytochrome/quinol oxidase subunit 2